MRIQQIRSQFPFLARRVHGKQISYLDNAATTQKPKAVIDRLVSLYASGLANVHRAMSLLAEEVTQEYETARDIVADFLNADPIELIFIPNATFGLNMVCNSLSRRGRLRVVSTTLEHHSNFLPWSPASWPDTAVRYVRWAPDGTVDLADLEATVKLGADLVAIASASNFLGALRPVREIAEICRNHGAALLVDASQSIAHGPTDVRQMDCDYLVFSGHKAYAPGGTGVLFVRRERAETLHPFLVGGNMVKEVRQDSYSLNDIPLRFEAGTPNIEGVICLGAALQWLMSVGWALVEDHEQNLTSMAKSLLSEIPGCQVHGPPARQPAAPIVSFSVSGLDAHAITKTLSLRSNIIVRSGYHCAQPAHTALKLGPTVRASFAVYNTGQEVEELAQVVSALSRRI